MLGVWMFVSFLSVFVFVYTPRDGEETTTTTQHSPAQLLVVTAARVDAWALLPFPGMFLRPADLEGVEAGQWVWCRGVVCAGVARLFGFRCENASGVRTSKIEIHQNIRKTEIISDQ